MLRIGCLGEVMLELILGEGAEASVGIAGDTYNTAVYLARELPGAVDYITVLGQDGFSDRIRSHMGHYGVGDGRVLTHPTRHPGLYAIETDNTGERRFTYWRSHSAARCLGDPELGQIDDLLKGLTHLLYTGISLAILPQDNRDRLFAAIDGFRAGGGLVAFDSNYRPHVWGDPSLAQQEIDRAWGRCDIALPSIDDEMAIFGDETEAQVLDRFAGYGLSKGALKRGEQGPLGLDGTRIPRPDPVPAVDTTAAGDSFNAGFLAAHLAGQDMAGALTAGHSLAAQVVGKRGAIIF